MIRPVLLAAATAAWLGGAEIAIAPFTGHDRPVGAVALDATVAATYDGRVRLWRLDDGSLAWVQAGDPPTEDATGGNLAIGAEVVVCSYARQTVALDRNDGHERWRREAYDPGAASDGRIVVLPVRGGSVVLDAATGAEHGRLPSGRIVFRPDGRSLLVVRGDGMDLARQDDGWRAVPVAMPPPAHGGLGGRQPEVLLAAAADGSDRLVTGDTRPGGEEAPDTVTVAWWRLPIGPGATPERVVDGLAAMPGLVLADGTLVGFPTDGWRNDPMQLVRPGDAAPVPRPSAAGLVTAHAASPDGRMLLLARRNSDPLLESAADGSSVMFALRGPAPAPPAQAMVRSGDGRRIALSTAAGLAVWDLALLRLDAWLPSAGGQPIVGTGIPGLGTVTSGDYWDDGVMPCTLVDVDGTRPWARGLGCLPPGFIASPDGARLALHLEDAVEIRDQRSGAVLARHALPRPASDEVRRVLAWSPDGSLIAAVSACRPYVIDGGWERTPATWASLVVRPGGETVRAFGDGEAAAALAGLPGAVQPEPCAPLASLPAAAAGPWYARLSAGLGRHGELVVRRDGGIPVHLLASSEAWAVWGDDGAFDGSRTSGRLVSASVGGRRVGLDEAVAACRPEQFLADLGCDDAELLRTAGAWTRRRGGSAQDRPGIQAMAARREGARVVLDAVASAAVGGPPIAAIEAWVDGVPLPVAAAGGRQARAAISVDLPPWPASIEVAARDAAGNRSWRTRVPTLPGPQAEARVVGACLGVSRYRNPALALRFAAKDALDVGLALGDLHLSRRDPLVRTWTDAEVVPGALDAVRAHLAAAEPQDLVVLYVAGHGLWLREPQPMWHLLPHAADPRDPAAGAITWSALAGVLDGCRALRRLIILDTCESGVAEDDQAAGPGLSIAGARGLRTSARVELGGLAGAWQARDRERLVTADLARTTGAVVLASSRGGEASFESEADANGLFTQELLAALRGGADADHDGWTTAPELVARVAARVAERSGGRQRPTIDRDNPLAAIRLPVLPPLE